MNTERVNRILASMKEKEVSQLIVTDPMMLFYVLGKEFSSGERMQALLLRADGEHVFFLNDLYPEDQSLGVRMVQYNDVDDAVALLCKYLVKGEPIAVDKNWAARFVLHLQELCPESKVLNSSFIIDYVRQIKSPAEQQMMIDSSLINDKVVGRMIDIVGDDMTELEFIERCRQIYLEEGCQGTSFPPIVAFATNAANPHHEGDSTKSKAGDCVVIDIGGMYNGYASDITRTVFIGEVSERQREIYNIVLEANRRGIESAKPGNRMCDVDNAARGYITEKGFGKYFTHRTGHSIGIEDHEFGDVSSVNTDIIRPGQCFSVEPGIYIPEEGIGVRIEDLVLITEDGCKVLNHYPKDIIVVEKK